MRPIDVAKARHLARLRELAEEAGGDDGRLVELIEAAVRADVAMLFTLRRHKMEEITRSLAVEAREIAKRAHVQADSPMPGGAPANGEGDQASFDSRDADVASPVVTGRPALGALGAAARLTMQRWHPDGLDVPIGKCTGSLCLSHAPRLRWQATVLAQLGAVLPPDGRVEDHIGDDELDTMIECARGRNSDDDT